MSTHVSAVSFVGPGAQLFGAAAMLAVAATGCSFGFGSTFVGQWRERDEVQVAACLEDASGRCVDEKQLVRHVPARAFSGFTFMPFGGIGAAYVARPSGNAVTPRFEFAAEYLRGRGRYAFGVRSGFTADNAFAVPVMLVGHYSLTPRVAVHGGAGYVVFGVTNAANGTDAAHLGFRGLVGVQLAIGRRREMYTTWNLEADTQWIRFDEAYRTTGLTTGFTFHF